MRTILLCAAAYFAIVFAAAFALGAVRVTMIAPRTGALPAVLIEVPIVLAIAWGVCRRLIGFFRLPATASARLQMGGAAFALLMAMEAAVSVFGLGRTLADDLNAFKTAAGFAGLLGQIGFALVPLAQRHR
jgi:hypothetical protein